MNKFFKEKRITWCTLCLVTIVSIAISAVATNAVAVSQEPDKSTYAENPYMDAVKDAMSIEENEVYPVLTITKEDELVKWNEDGTKVLMLTMHKYPDSYQEGQKMELSWGESWVTCPLEMQKWVVEHQNEVEDEAWAQRIEMLLGMSADGSHTHFSALWVSPEDMFRPAYNNDITNGEVLMAYEEAVDKDGEYKEWIDDTIVGYYFDNPFPWTRLGYTFDYADNGTDYGMSEFVIRRGAEAEVAFTYTVDEMIARFKAEEIQK